MNRKLPGVPRGGSVTPDAVVAALVALEREQALMHATRAVHGAALTRADGSLLLLREDVGRHNALDKLIGARARDGGAEDGEDVLCIVTSRLSYEMVWKAAVGGFPILVAISAPTALAIREARACGITLIALARGSDMTVFTGGHRVAGLGTSLETEEVSR